MKLRYASTCLAGVLLVLSSQSHAAASVCNAIANNLVANCGFEASSVSFSGWTLSGLDVPGEQDNLYGVESGADPLNGTNPHSGSDQAYFGDLTSRPTTLAQTLSTIAGQSYTVSFYLDQELEGTGNRNSLVVSFGSSTLATLTNVPVEPYTLYTYTGVATSSSTALSLKFGNDLGQFLLDDVSVVRAATVPEPSTLALFGVASLGLGLSSRRRQQRS